MSFIYPFILTVCSLLSFWRRNPLSCITLIVGLGVATALWSGVQALNAEARQSYETAASMLGADQFRSLVPVAGNKMPQQMFVDLRRAGWRVSPVVEGRIRVGDTNLQIIGIDPITLPKSQDSQNTQNAWLAAFERINDNAQRFLIPPYRALLHPSTLKALSWSVGDMPELADGRILPPIGEMEVMVPGTLLTDIGVAQQMLGMEGTISRLILHQHQKLAEAKLLPLIEGKLSLRQPAKSAELASLTDSFHLNLTAFGFLSFMVGLFIVNSAVGLAFENRRGMVRTLRACGVSTRTLAAALLAELLMFALISGVLGVLCGYLIATALLPDVAASLKGLYGAQVAGSLTLHWSWWLGGLSMAVLGATFSAGANLAKLVRMPILANANPFAWREANRRMRRWQLALAACLALSAITIYAVGGSLIAGFALMGAVLLAAALALPSALSFAISMFERMAKRPVPQWFWADSNQQMSGLSLALMALLLALAINVGVGTMVQSFRSTFVGWLDQRLAAELYINANDAAHAEKVLAYLETEPAVTAILPVWNADIDYQSWPIELFGIVDHATYRDHWPVLERTDDMWDELAAGRGLLISEQFARRFELKPGATLTLPSETGPQNLTIVGSYSDYGNPTGQALISQDLLVKHWPSIQRTRFGLRVKKGEKQRIYDVLQSRFEFGSGRLIDQDALKARSKSVFERTFAVTLALNALTLTVAGIAMLTNLLTLSQMRLPQLAPIWALGLTRKTLAKTELLKALSLALLTSALALPLGLLVAWILLSVINVEAFGWQLPMLLFPADWARLLLLALLTALCAAAYPAYRMWKMP
ncbi:MAG: FtsX-like permease family protein, partial [Rhizobiales bacterium]|nr:FtsX-like permease family protein [Hyphomicrobiales bacterium]